MCLETVAEGAILFLKKETVKNVFAGMPKQSEAYLSKWGGGNVFTQQDDAGWVSAAA